MLLSCLCYPVFMKQAPPTSEVRLLFEGSKLENIGKGEVFYTSEEPDRLMVVISGFAKQYFIAHEGSIGVQAIYGTDDILPITVVHKQLFNIVVNVGPEVYYYEAMTDLTLCSIDASNLRQRVEAHPVLYRSLLQSSAMRLRSNMQFMENLRLHGAYNKTAHQLAYLGYQFGKNISEGIEIQVPLIHQDIADIIGTTRETVTTSIIKLRDKSLIRTNRHILILDYDRLVCEAYA
ncbi:MAG: transcriptional regulator, Crp/Fnr family [Candidatus Saccharibacteria bacterium]|nr:transcriptional regulator, Crp/Fnr family [Candidatus Saccharibacteria bacterium]